MLPIYFKWITKPEEIRNRKKYLTMALKLPAIDIKHIKFEQSENININRNHLSDTPKNLLLPVKMNQ